MIYVPRPETGRHVDSSDPNRCSWDRELEAGLPDSRLSGPRRRGTTVAYRDPGRGIDLLMERCFCANCGCDGGLVVADVSPHVFFVCDPCSKLPHVAAQLRAAAGVVEVPESAVRGA